MWYTLIMKIRLLYRGLRLSPLLIIGSYPLWFTNGIVFGKAYHCANICYFIGWLIVSKKTEYHKDFIKRVNNRTWPKNKLWIIRYGR
ncbi:hypothetical protein LCGC14_1659710 [marine sediment metagenome]|uniref:Uncharacterized protein n=1 Tax=marine sediment metagenome TaxID=412755 RepID=A0A0F9KAB8_9ZZZZ